MKPYHTATLLLGLPIWPEIIMQIFTVVLFVVPTTQMFITDENKLRYIHSMEYSAIKKEWTTNTQNVNDSQSIMLSGGSQTQKTTCDPTSMKF